MEPNKMIEERDLLQDNNIDKILSTREEQYGSYKQVAEIVEKVCDILFNINYLSEFKPSVDKFTVRMIVTKLVRHLSGTGKHIDNMVDIQGYAKLLEREIVKQVNNSVSIKKDDKIDEYAYVTKENLTK